MGGDLTVTADVDATTIASSALSDFTPKLFDLLGDVARHASYPKSEVELAKSNFASEIEEERSQPYFLAQEQLSKGRSVAGSALFRSTMRAARSKSGALSTIGNAPIRAWAT